LPFFRYLVLIEYIYVPNGIENAYWLRFMAFSILFGTLIYSIGSK